MGGKKKGGIFGKVAKIAANPTAIGSTLALDKLSGNKLGIEKTLNGGKLALGSGGAPGAGAVYEPTAEAFTPNAQRQAFAEQLRQQSLGQGPSIAQQQLQTGTNRNISQLAGQVAASRSMNPALAQRSAMQQQADASQQAAGQSAQLRAQEMQQAQGAYGQELAAQQQAVQDREAMKAGQYQAKQDRQTNLDMANQQRASAATTGLLQGAATIFSDERMKLNVKPADLKEMVSKMKPKTFEYKQPNGESYQDGTVTGIMAQDLEKSKLGKSLVSDSPEGKQVDLKKAVPLTMAAVSEIVKRMDKLEKKKG
jgi:hypothetical protein